MLTSRADMGGAPEHMHQLLKSLGERYEFHVACPQQEPYWSRFRIAVGRERMLCIPSRSIDPVTLFGLHRYIKERNIQIVHSHGYGAGLLARLLCGLRDVPTVHTHHGVHFLWQRNTVSAAKRLVERVLARRASATIFVSNDELQAVRAAGLSPHGALVIPNGIDLGRLKMRSHESPAAPRRLRIVNANQFNECKNAFGLLDIFDALRAHYGAEAAQRMPQLDVYGDGPDRARFEQRIIELDLAHCVQACGIVPKLFERMPDYDLLLSCSHWEGLPIAVLEAMGSGLPAVLSRVPGHRELLRQGFDTQDSDMGFDIGDAKQAAQRLARLIDDAPLRDRIGIQARQLVHQYYGQHSMLDSVDACYTRLIERRADAPAASAIA
ncbi:glycosyltransferase family 4 protein [Hydrocarboniphaga effusa]|uniref:glycosyltransferase family 4 protein n=1 Tax=Hydrocarboniphaga effusa TaxID=243629 RepID=UPI00313788AE